MAEASLNLVFNQPQIPISVMESFIDEYEQLIGYTVRKLQRSWRVFRRTQHQPNAVRKRRVYRVFTSILWSWRSFVFSAQQVIGNGQYMDFQSTPIASLHEGEIPTDTQLREIDTEIRELEELMKEIFVHAKTRLVDDEHPQIE